MNWTSIPEHRRGSEESP